MNLVRMSNIRPNTSIMMTSHPHGLLKKKTLIITGRSETKQKRREEFVCFFKNENFLPFRSCFFIEDLNET